MAAPEGKGQTWPFAHLPTVAPEVLINTPLEIVTITLIEVYVPAGTDRFEPTKRESVCRTVISYDVGVIGTVTNVPDEGVSEIPATGRVKLNMETLAGGRSYRVILKLAFPPPPQPKHPPFFGPLHDPKTRTMTDKVKRNSAFIFMIQVKTEFRFQAQAEHKPTSGRCHTLLRGGYWRFGPAGAIVKSNR